jgi:NADPH-dependent glutamate synthase beta subunit-like oxidoreductase
MITTIDNAKCNGCGKCVDRCPLDTLRLNTDVDKAPPCQSACPAGIDIRGYMYLIKMGMFKNALELIAKSLPFPAITGCVCFHPCEFECARSHVDEAINIKSLERFAANCISQKRISALPRIHAGKVAIVGSGPAGLSAAYFLVHMGYPVKIFESLPELGGMLRYGIPEYRLPRTVLDDEIRRLAAIGVEFQTGVTVGKDITIRELKDNGYKATFIATGAGRSLKLNIPGEELAGVNSGLDILRDVNIGRKVEVGKKWVIIGGGNVAIDSARTAIRLGAEAVTILYRRSRQEMPANDEDVKSAEDEGVIIDYLTAPKKILGKNGIVEGVECRRVDPDTIDKSRNRRPTLIAGTEYIIKTDMVILAIGEIPDVELLNKELKLGTTSKGTIKIDKEDLTTAESGVFAGGDAVSGPSSVVDAIASGKKAAISIGKYLKGTDSVLKKVTVGKVSNLPGKGIEKKARINAPCLPAQQRIQTFNNIYAGYNEDMALDEVSRCMTCGSKAYIAHPDDCMTCFQCEVLCPVEAVDVHPFKEVLLGPIDILLGGKHG